MGLTPEGLRATFEGSYSEATDFERSSGHSWYDRTHDIAQALADRGNMPISNAAGSIAAMSPHNEFIRNLKDAKVAIDVVNGNSVAESLEENQVRIRRKYLLCLFGPR